MQSSFNTVKDGVKWLNDKIFSTAIHDEKIWKTADSFHADYDRKQLKQQKARLTVNKSKQQHITSAIKLTPHADKQTLIETSSHKQNPVNSARKKSSSHYSTKKISVTPKQNTMHLIPKNDCKAKLSKQHVNQVTPLLANHHPHLTQASFFNHMLANKQAKHLNYEQAIQHGLVNKQSAHHQQGKSTKSISQITASTHGTDTLFALTFLVKCINKEKGRIPINSKIKKAQRQRDKQSQYKIPGQPLGLGIPR